MVASWMMLATCFEAAIGELVEDAHGCAVGRKLGSLDVAAVGVEVEVVAGADGGVHVRDGDAGVGRLRGEGDGEGAKSEGKDAVDAAGHLWRLRNEGDSGRLS